MADRAKTESDLVQQRLASEIDDLKQFRHEATEALSEHRVRLSNGSEVFEKYDKRIKDLEPKPTNPTKVVGITLSVVAAGIGALLWLTDRFHERPTQMELREQIELHENRVHAATQDDIRSIQAEQARTRALLENAVRQLEDIGNRLPAPARR